MSYFVVIGLKHLAQAFISLMDDSIIIMDIFQCYFFREHIALSI